MASDEDVLPWLGHIGRDRTLAGDLRRAVNRAGGLNRGARSRFTGERIGRGGGVSAVLGARSPGGRYARRVIVKARFVKLAGKGLARAQAHLRYLQRDGTTRAGERGKLYGPDTDIADGKAFFERGSQDRHQFRFIVAAEDGAQFEDLKPLIRRLMAQAERDLDSRLDWIAVDHFNTGHPHSHILVRGKDERGADLVIARNYLSHGLRARAQELVELDLGPRTEREIQRAQAREVEQERFTNIDRSLLRAMDGDRMVSPAHPDGVEQAARAGRLQMLGKLGLATPGRRGTWRLDSELEPTLRAMGQRNDIIAQLHERMRQEQLLITPTDYAIHKSGNGQTITGRVLATGLSDEEADRRYLLLDATDGRAWHVDVGIVDVLPGRGNIVRISDRATLTAGSAKPSLRPVQIEILATEPLGRLVHHEGSTWLDKITMSEDPPPLERGFGAEVRNAIVARQRWLVERGWGRWEDGHFQMVRSLASARPLIERGRNVDMQIDMDLR